jgi:hypothetical protein
MMGGGTPPIFGLVAGGTGGSASIVDALGPCVGDLFGVTLVSFTPSLPGKAGRFEGTKPGVWQGSDKADTPGPYNFDVLNYVSQTGGTLKMWAKIQNPDRLLGPGPVSGYTNTSAGPRSGNDSVPTFVDYTANDIDPSKFLPAQIYELGNSLGEIAHKPPPPPILFFC